ncbi:DinB family protein [Paenibacillus sp. P46E]|uniref:DinB family protein n=1 Tax=Paenibacillus sp. P46E TaxID=1349436 RepID=UPI00094009D5|nr:DinB family protein [Paenibacillus sp. P46E]OKP95777.1 squalene--hopene cyclase [Paenibacillus sp. P46E]
MNQRPEQKEYSEFPARYIALVPPEGDLVDILNEQSIQVYELLIGLSEEQGNYRYAEGKWSVKQLLGHLTDNDRIMSYRLLAIARGEKAPLPGYEENDYAAAGEFDRFTLSEMVQHYKLVRMSTIALLESLPEEAWTRMGTASNHPISVRAIACVIIGHELHHLNVLNERYLNKV